MKSPPGWANVTVADLGGTFGGKTPSKADGKYWTNGTVPWVSPKDMKTFEIHGSEDSINEHAIVDAGMNLLPLGSVLMVTRSGILAHTLPVAVTMVPVTINQDIKAALPNHDVYCSRFLAYGIRALEDRILNDCTKSGTTVASVEIPRLEQLQIGFAPRPEQQRIADKLDAVLARVDACRRRLSHATTLLNRFRDAVLLAATTGELTQDYGTEAWSSVQLSDVALAFSYGSSAKSSTTGIVPVLRMGNIQNGKLDWTDLVYSNDEAEINKYELVNGDVLFNRTNSPELVGKTAVYKGERKAIYAGYLIRVRRGELVPQDPNDEPASVMLERLRSARAMRAETMPRVRAGARAPRSSGAPTP